MSLWKPLVNENLLNPYPMYEKIREQGGVYEAQTGELIVTQYEIVEQILKDYDNFRVGNSKEWITRGIEYFRTKDRDLTAIAEAINQFILLTNPPEHKELRSFISTVWNDKEVEEIIEDNCDLLIDKIDTNKEFDLIADFASNLPALTIAKIMGIPVEEYEELQQHGETMVKALDFYLKMEDLITIDTSARFFIKYFQNQLSSPPPNGLIKKLIDANNKREQPLSDQQLISIFIFLFIAGEETTTSFLSTSVYNLVRFDYWNQLTADKTEVLIDELLRFNGPVHLLGRIASKDILIFGHEIKKNTTITLCVAAANRDPGRYENPDKLILERKPRHLAFGTGIHFCLGDWLAKKQSTIALKKLKSTFPELTLTSEPSWKNQLAIRRMKELIVTTKSERL